MSQKNGPSIFKNISWKSGLVHSFEEFLSKLFIKNQIEKCDLPNCFMCIMMKGPFFWGISLQNILLKLRMGHSFEEKNDRPFFWDNLLLLTLHMPMFITQTFYFNNVIYVLLFYSNKIYRREVMITLTLILHTSRALEFSLGTGFFQFHFIAKYRI